MSNGQPDTYTLAVVIKRLIAFFSNKQASTHQSQPFLLYLHKKKIAWGEKSSWLPNTKTQSLDNYDQFA